MKKSRNLSDLKFNLLLAVTGCVQAEAIPRLVRRVKDFGVGRILVAATEPSLMFFDVREVEKVIENKVFVRHTDFTEEFDVPHIQLAEWADLIVVYPASANTIARCAHGFSDSLVANIILASRCPVYFGPSMNEAMAEKLIVQQNLKMLTKNGYKLIDAEPAKVKVRATKQIVSKMYVTEEQVLRLIVEHIKKKAKASS